MAFEFVFLSDQFFNDYANCPQIEKKKSRPHIRLIIREEGLCFAIPMRSSIKHPYAFLTDRANRCGIDYSKAVVIKDEALYIDRSRKPQIRQNEFNALKGKEAVVQSQFLRYLRAYRKAQRHPQAEHNKTLLAYSALQYFDDLLGSG